MKYPSALASWMGQTNHSAAKRPHAYLSEFLLHVGFALTGAGTVLLGSILPQASAQWHLQDKDAGLLLLVQFASSASGALLVRRNLRRALGFGYALFSLGAVGISLLQRQWFPVCALAFAIYGLGLGLAMTSTNMLFGRRYPARRGSALALLNFSWSAGALACPLAVAHFLRHSSSGTAFGLLGLLAMVFISLPLLAGEPSATTNVSSMGFGSSSEFKTIVYFATLAFLYVGIEATVGNWLSTFANRAASWSSSGSSLTVALFWASLLVGRGLTPAVLLLLPESRLHKLSVLTVIAGISLLLTAHNPPTILAAAALSGLALAPIFPLILSLFLAEIGESKHAGWVFAVAGFGGATLSWLTGLVSTFAGSLRIALFVPGVAAVLMMAMIVGRRSVGGLSGSSD